jgi:hypothetical protein
MMTGKLVMDLPPNFALCPLMDAEHHDLIIALATEIGVIMEDMSPVALMIGDDSEDLPDRLEQLRSAIDEMAALLAAARAIASRSNPAITS